MLVVDDHALLRDSMAAAIERVDGFETVGLASTVAEALAFARTGACDIVLLDLHLQAASTIGQVRELSEIPSVIVIAMSLDDSVRVSRGAIEWGAAAFLSKKEVNRNLEPLLRAATRSLEGRSTS